MSDVMGSLAQTDEYDPFAAEKFVNPMVQSGIGALLAPRVRDENSPVEYTTASPLVNITTQDIADATDKAMAFSGGGLGIKAYHGSPHSFDRFDLSKIGTGEGAQAYGHGLYFAEGENVAKSYRDQLAKPTIEGKAFNETDPVHVAASYIADHKTPEKALAAIERDLQWDKANPQFKLPQATFDALHDAQSVLRSGKPLPALGAPKGHMYEVNINADPAHFIDYDKPLSEQHPIVQQALGNVNPQENIAGPIRRAFGNEMHGGDLIGAPKATPDEIARTLAERGIPGIKYLDQGSRGAGEGSSNYVVFNPNIIDIMRKYGLAGAIGAGGMGALAAQDQYQPGGL